VGLVAAITGRLFDLGINLGDTTFAVLGGGAGFASVSEAPASLTPEVLRRELMGLPELRDAVVAVTPFTYGRTHGSTGRITHRVRVTGGDSPGLVARLSEAVVDFGANVVRLDTTLVPGRDQGRDQYVIRLELWIPPARADACLATLTNTAEELHLSCHVETMAESEAPSPG
jgi:glycine cleavage system transcriptional repressor